MDNPMSLILDALRKMEQDRRNRPAPAAALRPEVLRYRAQTAKRKRRKPYLRAFLGLLLLGAGIAAGWFALGLWHGVPVAIEAPAATASLAEPAGTAAPAAAPVTSTPAAATPPSAAATASAKQQPQALPQPPAPPVAAAAPPVAAPAARLNVTEMPVEAKLPKAKRARVPQATPEPGDNADAVQGAPQEINISGIAWQEERNLRRAVLNGTLVAEGAQVAGARVVEIKEDRVRLSRGGRSFEIVFSSALSSR
jgi:general secretion pathway protein B